MATGQRPMLLTPAAELAERADLSDRALQELGADLDGRAFLGRLVDKGLFSDAFQVASLLMPLPETLWWVCLCLWHVSRPKPAADVDKALKAVLAWLRQPSEAARRAAEAVGRQAGLDTPAGCLAMAVFWSGGSMSEPGLPEVPPPPELARGVAVSAVESAYADESPKDSRCGALFVRLALEVLDRANRWY